MMSLLRGVVPGVLRSNLRFRPSEPLIRSHHRKPSTCDTCLKPPSRRPCLDIRNVMVERGNKCHAPMIRSFLYNHYWPREPSVAALWMPLDCPYIDTLTDKYANSGDRLLAFEHMKRTGERKLVGITVANKIYPWVPDELEDWAHYTCSRPERNRMYFNAHCYRSPKFFDKYPITYIYDVEVLTTAAEVTGQGVGKLLLRTLLDHAQELRHTLVQVVAVSKYACKICERCGMQRAWTMDYSEFVDDKGQRVFFPRRPHRTVSIYVKYNDPKVPPVPPCKPAY